MLDWNDLQYVLALKEGRTMKQAAVRLKTDPTTVSRHIKRVSSRFGTDLFKMRKGGHWEMTSHGAELTILAQSFKNGLDQLNGDDGVSAENETIVITSLEFMLTHYLAPHIADGIRCFPETKLSLVGSDKRLSLAYGEADIALRFGRPTEGQLIASKIADVSFEAFARPGVAPKGWIGMQEDLDWTPEMQLGLNHFGKLPALRVSSFAAAREASIATGLAAVGPAVIMQSGYHLEPLQNVTPVLREVWSVIHETRRTNQRLLAARSWIKQAVIEAQRLRANGYTRLQVGQANG